MEYFSETLSVETVNARMYPAAPERSRRVMASLVAHLHAFIKDVTLTPGEWDTAIDFLTRTSQTCTDTRQEFILLSDVMGVSMLVDAVNNRKPDSATPSTVFGPFHVEGVPERPMGADISLDGKGEPCLFRDRVLDLDGAPIAHALVDVWSDNAESFYDVQQPDLQPQHNNCGVFRTGADGRYAFTGIRPWPTRSPMTARWGRCWPIWAATPGARRICISLSQPPDTSALSPILSWQATPGWTAMRSSGSRPC